MHIIVINFDNRTLLYFVHQVFDNTSTFNKILIFYQRKQLLLFFFFDNYNYINETLSNKYIMLLNLMKLIAISSKLIIKK